MIKFEDIAFGDLLYLEAGEYNAEGWHAVTVCYGDVREVALLEDKGPTHGTSLYPSDAHMIYKHIRVSGIPAAIKALEQIARGEIVVEDKQTGGLARVFLMTYGRSKGGCEAFESFCFAAYNLAKRALYAVRGEETK